jgi:membrane protease YdiL (CAAX protease family)
VLAAVVAFVFLQCALQLGLAIRLALPRIASLTAGAGAADKVMQALLQLASSRSFVLLYVCCTSLLAIAFPVLLAGFSPTPWRRRLRLHSSHVSPMAGLAMAAAFLAIEFLAGALAAALGPRAVASVSQAASAFASLSLPPRLACAILLGIGLAAGNELFFRGYVQTRLSQRLGRWRGILAAAALSALIQMNPTRSAIVFLFGIYLGWVTERTDSVRPAIATQALSNFSSILFGGLVTPTSQAAYWALLVSIALVCVVGILYLRKALPDSKDQLESPRPQPPEIGMLPPPSA